MQSIKIGKVLIAPNTNRTLNREGHWIRSIRGIRETLFMEINLIKKGLKIRRMKRPFLPTIKSSKWYFSTKRKVSLMTVFQHLDRLIKESKSIKLMIHHL